MRYPGRVGAVIAVAAILSASIVGPAAAHVGDLVSWSQVALPGRDGSRPVAAAMSGAGDIIISGFALETELSGESQAQTVSRPRVWLWPAAGTPELIDVPVPDGSFPAGAAWDAGMRTWVLPYNVFGLEGDLTTKILYSRDGELWSEDHPAFSDLPSPLDSYFGVSSGPSGVILAGGRAEASGDGVTTVPAVSLQTVEGWLTITLSDAQGIAIDAVRDAATGAIHVLGSRPRKGKEAPVVWTIRDGEIVEVKVPRKTGGQPSRIVAGANGIAALTSDGTVLVETKPGVLKAAKPATGAKVIVGNMLDGSIITVGPFGIRMTWDGKTWALAPSQIFADVLLKDIDIDPGGKAIVLGADDIGTSVWINELGADGAAPAGAGTELATDPFTAAFEGQLERETGITPEQRTRIGELFRDGGLSTAFVDWLEAQGVDDVRASSWAGTVRYVELGELTATRGRPLADDFDGDGRVIPGEHRARVVAGWMGRLFPRLGARWSGLDLDGDGEAGLPDAQLHAQRNPDLGASDPEFAERFAEFLTQIPATAASGD